MQRRVGFRKLGRADRPGLSQSSNPNLYSKGQLSGNDRKKKRNIILVAMAGEDIFQ